MVEWLLRCFLLVYPLRCWSQPWVTSCQTWGANFKDQKQAIPGHTAAMVSGATAGGPTVSWDHDTISMCCIKYGVKNGTAISGIGYRKSLVVTGWAISLLLAQMGLESSVYWHVLCFRFNCLWLWHHSHLQYLFQYLFACSMQIQREKAWEIWLHAVTSGRQRVDKQGAVPDINNFMLDQLWHREQWHWQYLANVVASSPQTDGTRKSFKTSSGTTPCVSTLCLPDITTCD